MNLKQLHDLRLSIWFDYLTLKQRNFLSKKGYFYLELELIPWEVIYKLTKRKSVILKFRELKRGTMRLVS